MFRGAVNVSNTLFQITAYELPSSQPSLDVVPAFKFIAYEPNSQMQVSTSVMVAAHFVVNRSRLRTAAVGLGSIFPHRLERGTKYLQNSFALWAVSYSETRLECAYFQSS